MNGRKNISELFLDVPPEVNALIENADCKQPAAATDWYLLSPEFIWNTNANTNTNVTSSQMVRLHDKTSARQSYVHCSVLFSSKCIWDAPLRNVCFRERLRDLLVLLGRCSREVARFCGAARLRESLLKIVTILLLKYSTISLLQSATLIIVVFFSKQRGFKILWSKGWVSLAPNIGSEFCS